MPCPRLARKRGNREGPIAAEPELHAEPPVGPLSSSQLGSFRYRARRRFFKRDCRIFRAFLLGLEIARVTLPTLFTFQPFSSVSPLFVSIRQYSQREIELTRIPRNL